MLNPGETLRVADQNNPTRVQTFVKAVHQTGPSFIVKIYHHIPAKNAVNGLIEAKGSHEV